MELYQQKCIPCAGGVPPLKGKELAAFVQQLGPSWNVIDEQRLEKEYSFKNFRAGMLFANKVADLADAEGHHPDLYISYTKVQVILWTHKIGGLAESDFIFAAKCDRV